MQGGPWFTPSDDVVNDLIRLFEIVQANKDRLDENYGNTKLEGMLRVYKAAAKRFVQTYPSVDAFLAACDAQTEWRSDSLALEEAEDRYPDAIRTVYAIQTNEPVRLDMSDEEIMKVMNRTNRPDGGVILLAEVKFYAIGGCNDRHSIDKSNEILRALVKRGVDVLGVLFTTALPVDYSKTAWLTRTGGLFYTVRDTMQ